MLIKNFSSLNEFNKTIPEYQSTLEKSGYKKKLTYVYRELRKNRSIQLNLKKQIKKQNKKDYLVQPPFNEEVSTNIGKEFFTLFNKNFPSSNKYHKIFNKNNIKLSYS